ncbi:Sensor protein FixL [Rhodoplanes serenus]|uniref:histidine kinase n=1 Tax=Rhodoplanes serenus TaxID=200615 RepID=A0A3S4BV96_9BRAD|nr:sensor histidine kinase [Rhodoplanes serenus]VCU08168.1 Sensor protein FixL [Rhodoplanes serenus]
MDAGANASAATAAEPHCRPATGAVGPDRGGGGLTIRHRLFLLVVACTAPMLLLSFAIIWQLAHRERETSRQAITYASRSIVSAVDAQFRHYIAVGQALAISPSLQTGDLAAFRAEAERAMTVVPGGWLTLADTTGQQLVNTLIPAGEPLPRLAPAVAEDGRRAFASKTVKIADVVFGPVAKAPVTGIGVPVFRGGEPAYYLLVGVPAASFRALLNDGRMPEGWLVAVIDSRGNLVARSRDHDRLVGQPAAAGWRAAMHRDGLIETETLEGRPVLTANTVSPLTGWAVGVASERALLEARVWRTLAVAGLASVMVSVASGLLAAWIARRITVPIQALETGAGLLERGERVRFGETRVPEIDRALHAFDAAAAELTAHERAVATLQSELWHVSRLSEMGQMAAALAHELNQPLTALAVYVGGCERLMKADPFDDARREQMRNLLKAISDQALRAGEIIKQLRSFVQKGEGERRVESAGKVMREAARLAMTAAKHKDVTFRCNVDDTASILVNKVQIQQVVFNLIRNAIEAMETSARREIDVTVVVGDGQVETSIADTGCGLAPEIAARLFMPFASTKTHGMGIGLSVCRDIIEAHRGRIWADSIPDGGTVFRFTLPVVSSDPADDSEPTET